MKAKLVGIQKLDYVNKAGKQVKGTSLHTVHDGKDMDGQAVETFWISDAYPVESVKNLKIGMSIDVQYNRFGGIDDVIIL